ncbi:MAG: hypothetical protein RSA27_06465, partial [Oscillospiraceae bacterium]
MKKIFVCFAILTFLFCGSAYATPANIKLNPPVYEGSNIVIKGELASKNKETVSLISYKKGGRANNPNDVVSVIERPSNDDGKFSFTFTMQDEKGASINGDYVVRVMAKDNARSEVEFSYLCEDTRNEVLNTLDKISSKTQFSEFINNSLYENIFIVAGVDFGKYKG